MHMKKILLTFIFLFLATSNAQAKLNVVTTLPNFAYLVHQIGGDLINVKSLLGKNLDPHFIDAKPTFILQLNQADLLISNGLDMEIGYLPLLLDQARNTKVRTHAAGSLVLGNEVPVLDVPTRKLSREMGDVHPYGNPHFYLSPANVPLMAKAISKKLIELDPEHQAQYTANLKTFLTLFESKLKEWKVQLLKFGNVKIITYHKSLGYLVEWLGWTNFDTIEPKPGVPPSTSRLADLATRSQTAGVKLILAEKWYPSKDGKFLSEKTAIPILWIDGLTDDYIAYFDSLFGTFSQSLH